MFTLYVMVQETVRTLGACLSRERSVTGYYLCWKELIHRDDLSSSPVSSAADQSAESVDLKLISWNLNSFLFALLLLFGEWRTVLFSPQRAQEQMLSASGLQLWGAGGDQAPAQPSPAGPSSLLGPLHLSHKMSRGFKYVLVFGCGFFYQKKKEATSPCLHPEPSLEGSTLLSACFAFSMFLQYPLPSLLPHLPVSTLPSLPRAPSASQQGACRGRGLTGKGRLHRGKSVCGAWRSERPALKCAIKCEEHPLKSVRGTLQGGYWVFNISIAASQNWWWCKQYAVLYGKGFLAVCRLLYLQKVAGSKRGWGLPSDLCHAFNFSFRCFVCNGVRCSLLRFGNGVFAQESWIRTWASSLYRFLQPRLEFDHIFQLAALVLMHPFLFASPWHKQYPTVGAVLAGPLRLAHVFL